MLRSEVFSTSNSVLAEPMGCVPPGIRIDSFPFHRSGFVAVAVGLPASPHAPYLQTFSTCYQLMVSLLAVQEALIDFMSS